MPKRDTVQPNVDSIAEKVSAKSWSEASFSKMIGKHKRWLSEVRRGKNLPSPEEAARICQLLKATPDEILLREGETPEATAKCLENIETVRKLVEAEGIKETPDPKIEGVDDKIAQFIRSASADELTEISRYIEYLESKRNKT
jgi:transcriptional regulator with XRE-family HTH domain